MLRIDLHTHSRASDGSLSPRDLIARASADGISTISITDHDTIAGLPEAMAAGAEFGIDVISGVELSVNHENGSLHLLGYGFDYENEPLVTNIARLRASREARNERIIEKLNRLNLQITEVEVQSVAGGGAIGRGHIGTVLIQKGYVSTLEEAFDRYLTRGGPAYVDRFRLEMKTAIGLIHGAGGIAVWAHPGLHGPHIESLLTRLSDWARFGLDGIESDYSQHTIALRDRLRRLAGKYGLIATGGSDFHGDMKPHIHLGDGPEKSAISPECVAELRARLDVVRQDFF